MSALLSVLSILCALTAATIALWAGRPDRSPIAKFRRELNADPMQRSMVDASPQVSGYRLRQVENDAERARTANWWIAFFSLASAVFGLAAILAGR